MAKIERMLKKIGILALLMLCFTLNMEAQKNSKDAQRKAKLKEIEQAKKDAKKGKNTKKDKETKELGSDDGGGGEKWTDRLVGGGGLGGGYSNGWRVTLTPWVGYKITDRLWTGIGVDYNYASYKDPRFEIKETYSVLGPKVFANYYITQDINAGTEFVRNTFKYTETFNGNKFKISDSFNSWLIGGGYTQRMGGRAGIRLELFYDVLYDESNNNFRRSPFDFRLNFIYGL